MTGTMKHAVSAEEDKVEWEDHATYGCHGGGGGRSNEEWKASHKEALITRGKPHAQSSMPMCWKEKRLVKKL